MYVNYTDPATGARACAFCTDDAVAVFHDRQGRPRRMLLSGGVGFGLPPSRYGAYIASDRWAARRERYFASHPRKCAVCGSKASLELHHLSYERLGRERDDDLAPLCHRCHAAVHLVADSLLPRCGELSRMRLGLEKTAESKITATLKKWAKEAAGWLFPGVEGARLRRLLAVATPTLATFLKEGPRRRQTEEKTRPR